MKTMPMIWQIYNRQVLKWTAQVIEAQVLLNMAKPLTLSQVRS